MSAIDPDVAATIRRAIAAARKDQAAAAWRLEDLAHELGIVIDVEDEQPPVVRAFITLTDGMVTADSTCTIGEQSIAVPPAVASGSVIAPSRIAAAIRLLGHEPVRYYATLRTVPGGVTIEVEPTRVTP